ncbi:MAG: nucleotidyltransferase family protein [Bryobacteraceae bacterium]|nr:nucleotidyltransferase family protein [Bryobacteraceae bacterium]
MIDLGVSPAALAATCARYRVKELAVFGSIARGEAGPDSDIDLLVEFEPDARIGWEFFDLEDDLTHLFRRKVDLGTKRSLKPWVRASVLREAQLLYAA